MQHPPRRWTVLPLALVLALGACAYGSGGDAAEPDPQRGPVVTADDIERAPSVQVENQMMGRFPGVRIIPRPGGGFSVRFWGPTSIIGNQEPLYVIDGMPVQVDPSRGLYWLNPLDVASIRVLKDVAQTAQWGVRGGNGVVVITTKKGSDGE